MKIYAGSMQKISYDYQPGQKILKKKHGWTKLGERRDGPFEIKKYMLMEMSQ